MAFNISQANRCYQDSSTMNSVSRGVQFWGCFSSNLVVGNGSKKKKMSCFFSYYHLSTYHRSVTILATWNKKKTPVLKIWLCTKSNKEYSICESLGARGQTVVKQNFNIALNIPVSVNIPVTIPVHTLYNSFPLRMGRTSEYDGISDL